LDAVRPSLAERPLALDLEVADGILLDSYPGALDQVVIELIRNAADHAFSGERGGRLGRILIKAHLLGPDTVDLSCYDDGRGLAPDKLRRIFEPFYTTRLGHGGSGLGLCVAYNLAVNVLQGSLNAESREGEGSCLRLLIPRVVG
jgi:signal transduction histidine kinase